MTLQDKCCTVEQGKRLAELGVPTEGVTFWHMPAKSGTHGEWIRFGWHGDAIAPAFDVAELGQLLPSMLPLPAHAHGSFLFLEHIGPCEDQPAYFSEYVEIDEYYGRGGACYACDGETEAQARATLLIYLLENNIITFKPDTVTLAE